MKDIICFDPEGPCSVKMAFDAKRLFFNRRGLGVYARTTVSNLIRFFPEHDYFLFSPKPNTPIPDPDAFDFSHDRLRPVFPRGAAQWFHPLWRSWGLTDSLTRLCVDIFHGLSNELPFNIQHFAGKKIVTLHDVLFLRLPGEYPWLDRQTYRLKFRHAAQAADHIVAVSEQTRKDIHLFFKIPLEKISVVYQTCHPSFQKPVNEKRLKDVTQRYQLPRHYILYHGALESKKNVDLILDAWPRITPSLRPAVVLVGRGSRTYVDSLYRKAQANRMATAFKIIEINTCMTDLAAIFHMARAFVFPSLFEGFGIPVIQAQFCRTPVLASKNAGLEEAAGTHSLFFDSKSPEQLAHGISEVLSNEVLHREMRSAGDLHIQKFLPENTARKLMDVYQRVMNAF